MEVVLILTLACLTYFTRTLGHLVVSRFGCRWLYPDNAQQSSRFSKRLFGSIWGIA